MSETTPEKNRDKRDDDMRPEYDFTDGVRGKNYRAYRQGHTVTVYHADGTSTVRHVQPDDDAVFLDPDVRQFFPDSESVNNALRGLIELVPGEGKPS
jgi:hypothetical protein